MKLFWQLTPIRLFRETHPRTQPAEVIQEQGLGRAQPLPVQD